MTISTSDLCDAHADVQVCDPIFRDFGGVDAFHGEIATLKVFEDNAAVRATLEQAGERRVLVVDGGGSRRCALFGGNLGALALRNGWTGVLIYGCVRDRAELAAQAVGVKALAAHPRKSEKGLHAGHAGRSLEFAGVRFVPGAWLYADRDGIVLAARALHV